MAGHNLGINRVIMDIKSLEDYVRGSGKGSCTLMLPGLPDENARLWERRLSQLQATCGCTAGLVGGIIGIAGWIALEHGRHIVVATVPGVFLAGLGAFVIPAVVAKFATIALAGIRLRREGRALLAELRARECKYG